MSFSSCCSRIFFKNHSSLRHVPNGHLHTRTWVGSKSHRRRCCHVHAILRCLKIRTDEFSFASNSIFLWILSHLRDFELKKVSHLKVLTRDGSLFEFKLHAHLKVISTWKHIDDFLNRLKDPCPNFKLGLTLERFETFHFSSFRPSAFVLQDRPLSLFWSLLAVHFYPLIHPDRPLLVEWPSTSTHDRPIQDCKMCSRSNCFVCEIAKTVISLDLISDQTGKMPKLLIVMFPRQKMPKSIRKIGI